MSGELCSKTPPQLQFTSANAFEEMRSLRNEDGMWMALYCRSTKQWNGDILTTLSAIREGLSRRAESLGVEDVYR